MSTLCLEEVSESQSSTCSPFFTQSLTPPSPYHQAVWVSAILQGGPLPPGGALLSHGTDYAAPDDAVLTLIDTGMCGTRGLPPSEHGSGAHWSPIHAYTNICNITPQAKWTSTVVHCRTHFIPYVAH